MRYYRIFLHLIKIKIQCVLYLFLLRHLQQAGNTFLHQLDVVVLLERLLVTPVKAAFTDEGFSKSKYTPSVSTARCDFESSISFY